MEFFAETHTIYNMSDHTAPTPCPEVAPAGTLAGMFFAGLTTGILISLGVAAWLWKYKLRSKISLSSGNLRNVVINGPSRRLNTLDNVSTFGLDGDEAQTQPSFKYDHVGFVNEGQEGEMYESLEPNTRRDPINLSVYQDPQSVPSLLKICPAQPMEVSHTVEASVLTESSRWSDIKETQHKQRNTKITSALISENNVGQDPTNQYFVLESSVNGTMENRSANSRKMENPTNEYFVLESSENSTLENRSALSGKMENPTNEYFILESSEDGTLENRSALSGNLEDPTNEYFVLESSEDGTIENRSAMSGKMEKYSLSTESVVDYDRLDKANYAVDVKKPKTTESFHQRAPVYFILEKKQESSCDKPDLSTKGKANAGEHPVTRRLSTGDPGDADTTDIRFSVSKVNTDDKLLPVKFNGEVEHPVHKKGKIIRARIQNVKVKNSTSSDGMHRSQEKDKSNAGKPDADPVPSNTSYTARDNDNDDKEMSSPTTVDNFYENESEQHLMHQPTREPTYTNMKTMAHFNVQDKRTTTLEPGEDDLEEPSNGSKANAVLQRNPTYENIPK